MMPGSNPAIRTYRLLALVFLALATYASLVPFDFRSVPTAEAIERYRAVWLVPIRVESRSDWLSNILLFAPLGYLLAGWLGSGRGRMGAIVVAIITVPVLSAGLSAAIEFIQVYFPSRTVSVRDVVAEAIGGTIGGASWLVLGSRVEALTGWLAEGGGGRAAWILPAYVLALVLDRVMPLDITISPGELAQKYRSGMIAPVPFAGLASGATSWIGRSAGEVATFLVAGLLAGRAAGSRRVNVGLILVIGLTLAGLIELLQVFIVSRRADATDVIIGASALSWGWLAARVDSVQGRRAFLLGWGVVVVCSAWAPFDFGGDVPEWLERALTIDPLPFADLYRGSPWTAAGQLFLKASLFFPLGMMAGLARRGTLLASAGLAILFEAGQLAMPGHTPSLTDVIVEVAGAWLGLASTGGSPAISAAQEHRP